MNPLFDPVFPHGTPTGFTEGCKTNHCPALISCRVFYTRYRGDHRFRTRFDNGMTLDAILAIEAEERASVRAAERAAKRTPRPTGKRNGWVLMNREPVTELQLDVTRHHAEGLTDNQIAGLIGKTREQVRMTRRWLNLPLNPEPRTAPLSDKIRVLHGRGYTDKQIAERVDRSPRNVAQLRARMNLAPNKLREQEAA